jgi:hypothetical protein
MDPFAPNCGSVDNGLLIFRSLFAINPTTNLPISSQYIFSADGIGGIQWQDIFTNMSTFSKLTGAGVGYLPSTLSTLSTAFFSLSNTVIANNTPVSLQTLTNSVNGLGNNGYVSSTQLTSTIDGLGTYGYVSTSGLQAFASGLYLQNVTSTNTGLGTLGYASSLSLYSTIAGLGSLRYISSTQLTSSIRGLGTYGYVSSLSLQSTVTSFNNSQISTLDGLGSYGYISSLSLQSTVKKLLQNISLGDVGALNINNGNIVITNVNGSLNFSNIRNSTITYKGINGLTQASTFNTDMYFSSANLQLSSFTNYITNASKITADIFPNFVFCSMADPLNYNRTQLLTLSTYLTYQNTNILTTTNNSLFAASSYSSSNVFQTPMRMSFSGTDIPAVNKNNAVDPTAPKDDYVLMHRLVNGLTSNITPGLANSNIQLYMASTNSVFLTVQNNSL